MAIHSLLTLLDDITLMLDDIALLSKVAAKKTAGVLGDDLALNAQQVGGVRSEREWPVVWAVAKGSFWNKCILVPLALLLVWLAPWLITPLLMLGGAYLCFEGVEKIAHKLLHPAQAQAEELVNEAEIMNAVQDPSVDMLALEKEKIKGAIRTDFILSAEIIVIALGTIAADLSIGTKAAVLAAVAIAMTVGVYGVVALIVKIDDLGLYLMQKRQALVQWLGGLLLKGAPVLMQLLTVVGTAAMFLVGGGIVAHGIPPVAHWIEGVSHSAQGVSVFREAFGALLGLSLNAGVGLLVGCAVVALLELAGRIKAQRKLKT